MNIWIQRAEIFDAWRVVPRTLLFGYCGWAAWVFDTLLHWYINLPATSQTIQNAGLLTAVGTVLTGFGVPIFNIYIQNGRDWNAQPQTTETVVATKTTGP